MALMYTLILVYFLLLLNSFSTATISIPPKGFILPVNKDSSTLQYTTSILQRTPLVPVKLTIHLSGQILWLDCQKGYISSSYKSARCNSTQCAIAKSHDCRSCDDAPKTGCSFDACHNTLDNPAIKTFFDGGEVAEDVISMVSYDGSNPGRDVIVPGFVFSCVGTFLTEGLASGVTGMAGLGRSQVAFPTQLAQAFSFKPIFSICLSSSTSSNGVVIFGDGPYNFLPKNTIDVNKSLIYTPLITNPFGIGAVRFLNEPSSEYFIGVKSIKINGKTVSIDKKLLSINKKGNGGTKISSTAPYTVLHPSIYTAVTNAFVNELANVSRVASVAPFGACFSSKNIVSTRVGPEVPTIDLVLQKTDVIWRIFGVNSMVQVSQDVMCLGFVDGGPRTETSIVIGGRQIEDNLLRFDLVTSRLGFSSSLLLHQTNCANFNITSTI